MKFKDHWAYVEEYSKLASNIARGSAYALTAAIWATNPVASSKISRWMLAALAALVVFYLLDYLQYLTGWLKRKRVVDSIENKAITERGALPDPDENIPQPADIDSWPIRFFVAKNVGLFLAAALFLIGLVDLSCTKSTSASLPSPHPHHLPDKAR